MQPSAQSLEYYTKVLEAVNSGKGKEIARDAKFAAQNPLSSNKNSSAAKQKKAKKKKQKDEPYTIENFQREYVEQLEGCEEEDFEDGMFDLNMRVFIGNNTCYFHFYFIILGIQ